MLDQSAVVPRFGPIKGLKGKGDAPSAPATGELVVRWQSLVDDLACLSAATKAMQPKYFYLDLKHVRARGYLHLRWRTIGRGGSSLTFEDPRFQKILVSLPVPIRRQYQTWEMQRINLNQRSTELRRASIQQISVQELIQLLSRW